MKRGDPGGDLSLTLGAARSAAQEFTATMKDKERKRAKAKRRKLKERRLLEAAAKAAADAGLDFTGTMKKRAMDVLAQHRGGADDSTEYADDGFEADDGDDDDATAYESDFEDEIIAAVAPPAGSSSSGNGMSAKPRKHHRRNTSSSTAASLSLHQHGSMASAGVPAARAAAGGGGGDMESIQIGSDAAFEATLGGKRAGGGGSKKKNGKGGSSSNKREKQDAFSETYSRSGLPGRRVDVDSDDDAAAAIGGNPLGAGSPHHPYHHRAHSLTDEQLPALLSNGNGRAPSSGAPTGRGGHSPRSSPGTSNYLSDASASQLPTIGNNNTRKR